jgi:hypothetical protein
MIRKTLLIGLAGLYILLFGEVFLRVMDPQPLMPRYVVGTDWGIRGNEPSITYRHWTPETETRITTNSLGMRDSREFAELAEPVVCRIALMGDSYFMGYEVDVEDSIAGFLEAEFEAAGYDLDVLNFAVSGHGTSEMILHFENLAARFSPDVVVFQFHSSDYTDNIRANLHRLTPGGVPVATGGTYLPAVGIRTVLESIPAFRWVSENSQIYAGAREKAAVMVKRLLADINLRANAAEGDGADPEAEGGGAEATRGHRLTGALIGLSRRVAEDAGASWYLFDVPTRRSRTEFISTLYRMDLPPDLAGRAVSPLPLFEAAAAPDVKLFYEEGHLHFTPLGNRLAAQALFERIVNDSGARLGKCRRAA